MGTGGSLPNNLKSQEPPPLPPPFYTGNPHYGISRMSGSSCDSQRDRRTSGTSTVILGNPGSQHPRSSGSMKNEEWWHHRPSASSLSGPRPQQETLLTYAAQMTGWQTGCDSTVPSMHQEAMELSRTVSHLAAANQQLASAHTTLLSQLEGLYLELNRERELRLDIERNETRVRGASTSSDCENEREKLTDRIETLEATINDRTYVRDRKLRFFHDEETKTLSTKEIGVQSDINISEELEIRLGTTRLETKNPEQFFNRRDSETERNFGLSSVKNAGECEKIEQNDLSHEYRKAVDRIQSLENELAILHVNVVSTIDNGRSENTRSTRKNIDEIFVQEYESIDGRRRCEVKNSNCEKDLGELLREIERLNNDRLEYRERNEKLTDELEKRAMLMETLRRDYEISRSQCEKIETSLNERNENFDDLILNYESAKLEKTRLSKELRVLNIERETANVRITDLEKELAIMTREKEQISNISNQESSRLRKILSDEMTSKKEQARALEEALEEIKRLNEIIENGEKNDEATGEIEIPENETSHEEEVLDLEISAARSSNMEEFRKELSLKREARQRAIAAVSSEMERLRRELDAEKEAHSETSRVLDLLKSGQATIVATKNETIDGDSETSIDEDLRDNNDWRTIMKTDPELCTNEADAQALTDILKVSDELKSSIRLQTEKIDDLRYHLECEPEGHKNRIASLKDIARTSRESSGIRERQMNKLKNLLAQILARLGDPRFRVEITDDVRSEHDRQLEDIRRLKCLYDDRLRILADLRESASKELTDVKEKLKSSRKENCGLEEDLKKAEEKIDIQDTEISNLESQLGLTKADCRDLQNQMSVINGLFTQMLLSASSADMDLDRLTRLLQENHDLISDMAREEGTEAAALPKLLLDIVEQVEGRSGVGRSGDGENDKKEDDPQEDNIAHNLPKVWRVLLELLSCHAAGSPAVTPASLSTDPNSCYKSVDTPSGPRLVISVSKTYIRLKELILEKKHLEKEMNRMKTLNTHLESKLGEQEKRLSTVSSELSKTWNIVGRMQAQHQQLHTHEKILRYELQQKRKMLQELKQELEYCREKWESARQKNTNTEIEWRSLRREFAARKSLASQDSFNNSGESGFSDERGDDSDEDDETVGERVRIGPRRRARKENPRAPTPDTESEQPTDNELSETKTTPETNLSTEDVSIASTSASSTEKLINDVTTLTNQSSTLTASEDDEEFVKPMNPLDRALTNVIQNLIITDESNPSQSAMSVTSSENEYNVSVPSISLDKPEVEEKCVFREDKDDCDEEILKIDEAVDSSHLSNNESNEITANDTTEISSICTVSVFSIGPFPTSTTPPPAKSVQFSDPLVVGPSFQSVTMILGDSAPETVIPEKTTKIDEIKEIIGTTRSLTNKEEIEKEEINNSPIASYSGNTERSIESWNKDLPEVIVSCSTNDIAATSSTSSMETLIQSSSKPLRSQEEILAARAARLKRLEEQADWLMKKMNATSIRGSALSTRLEELHEAYGEAPVPPPMPDVLPNVRIPSELRTQQEETAEKSPNETPPPDSP